MLLNSLLRLSVLAGLGAAVPSPRAVSPPRADILNGTYVGVSNKHYNQDFFLGIPFAQQPIGNLRFALPTPLNETWDEERDAKEYSDICVGYGVSTFLRSLQGGRLEANPRRLILFGIPSQKHA